MGARMGARKILNFINVYKFYLKLYKIIYSHLYISIQVDVIRVKDPLTIGLSKL